MDLKNSVSRVHAGFRIKTRNPEDETICFVNFFQHDRAGQGFQNTKWPAVLYFQ